MKNIFRLILFYLFKKPIKIQIKDMIGGYLISEIEWSLREGRSETVRITLQDVDGWKIANTIPEYIKRRIK